MIFSIFLRFVLECLPSGGQIYMLCRYDTTAVLPESQMSLVLPDTAETMTFVKAPVAHAIIQSTICCRSF